MKDLKSTVCILFILFIAVACSKEKRIENRLCKGEWNIAKYTVTYPGFFYGSGVADAGTMAFSKNGSLVWTETIDSTQVYNCTWSNSKDEITIVREGQAYIFKIDSESGKEMQIVTTVKYVDEFEDPYNYDLTLKLERK